MTAQEVPAQPQTAREAEKTGLTHSDIRDLIKRHGGGWHGPNVEHISMEEQAFWRFLDELILNERRTAIAALSVTRPESQTP